VRGVQILIALVALVLAPIVGLVAPVFAVFAGTSGIAGLSAASWRKSMPASLVFTALQIAALVGFFWIALQPIASEAQLTTAPAAENQTGGPGAIPATDRAAP